MNDSALTASPDLKTIYGEGLPQPYRRLHIYYLEGELDPTTPPCEGYLGAWVEEGCSFLFFSRPCKPVVEDLLQSNPQIALVDAYQMSYEQWQGAQPAAMRLGAFRITPPWLPSQNAAQTSAGTGGESAPAAHELILDPGVVFGNGTHATTRDCLGALEIACRPNPPERVLDLGTGTGLLALAAAALGCRCILAVDNNFLAARTARTNVRLNQMERRVLVVQGAAQALIPPRIDLLVANIHYEVMGQIIASSHFTARKRFILSGLLRSEGRDIVDRLRHKGARIHKQWERDGIWHTYYGEIG